VIMIMGLMPRHCSINQIYIVPHNLSGGQVMKVVSVPCIDIEQHSFPWYHVLNVIFQ
jgi:hypothetical protein